MTTLLNIKPRVSVDPKLVALLPKSKDLKAPVLYVLRNLGGTGSNQQIEHAVIEYLRLPEEVASIPHLNDKRTDNRTELGYRLAWAQTNLKNDGILEQPRKGWWQIISHEKQKQKILEWFRSRYKDPAQCCEKAGSSYKFVWGSPVRPRDVIREEFGDKFDDTVIEAVSQELSKIRDEWSPAPDYEKYYVPQSTYLATFQKAIREIEEMAGLKIPADKQQIFLRMLYARIYAVVETYLCDALNYSIVNDETALRKFVSNISITNQAFKLEELFDKYDNIKALVTAHLNGTMVWHKFGKAEDMYKVCYGISFPSNELDQLYKGSNLRHHIVHRDGKDEKGNVVPIEKKDILSLVVIARNFIEGINERLEAAREPVGE